MDKEEIPFWEVDLEAGSSCSFVSGRELCVGEKLFGPDGRQKDDQIGEEDYLYNDNNRVALIMINLIMKSTELPS